MSETLYRKVGKRYVPVAEIEKYEARHYPHGIYLVFSRPGCVSTIKLQEKEEDIINLLHTCVEKLSETELSKIINDAHDKVMKKENGNLSYIPSDWYRQIAKDLLESLSKN